MRPGEGWLRATEDGTTTMAIYSINPANSVTTTVDGVHAFSSDTPLADALAVDSGAYLLAKGAGAFGAYLANTQTWKVQVNGAVKSEKSAGLYLSDGNAQPSSISVGEGGLIEGANAGLYSLSNATIVNFGTIRGGAIGVYSEGSAAQTIRNAGAIEGGSYSILTGNGADSVTNTGYLGRAVALGDGSDVLNNTSRVAGAVFMGAGDDAVINKMEMESDVDLGAGNDKLTNSGTIHGIVFAGDDNDLISNSGKIGKDVFLGNGNNILNNSGIISGYVLGGSSDDVVKNTGTIDGLVDLGAGNDTFTGGNGGDNVVDGAGADNVRLGGGSDIYRAFGGFNQVVDGIDTIDGGAGIDVYDASNTTSAVYVNLDKVAHDASPLAPGVGAIAANLAMTANGTQNDKILNIESVNGGSGDDFIYGSSTSNEILGNAGADTLFGFGGTDIIYGGEGADTLVGGAGKDYLAGGALGDYFAFVAASESGVTAATRDVIEDFASGADLIDLRFIDANTRNGAVNDAFSFIGAGAFGGVAGQLRVYAAGGSQIVEGDINGDGNADFSIEVLTSSATLPLTATDFLL